jgi:hypothetical protein
MKGRTLFMKQRISLTVIASFVMALILSACGGAAGPTSGSGSSAGGSPADAAKGYYEAMYTGGSAENFFCTGDAATTAALKQGLDAAKAAMAAAKTKVDISGLKFDASNQTGDAADVKVSGKLKTTVGGNSIDTDYPAITLKMKNQSGWKVCGASV